MRKRKRFVSIMAGLMAAVMLLTLIFSLLPRASAASSSEIRKQINELKKEKEELKGKIQEVKEQYKENEDEIADLIDRKSVVDQEIQLLYEQIENINEQLSTYNILIADKQDELDAATSRYRGMNEQNRVRIRTMEEEGTVSYWEVLFQANSFSDLLDRMSMVEEIAAADKKHLKEMSDAADAVELAQMELTSEKEEVEAARLELDETEKELEAKRQESYDLLQQLLSRADELEERRLEFEAQEEAFLKEIAAKEVEFSEAKQREWEAYMATYVPPTTAPAENNGGSGNNGGNSGGNNSGSTGGGGGGWIWPCSARSITSPFGKRNSPTAGASTNHMGIDIDGKTGDDVWAARAGVVSVASSNRSAGNYVQINHQDGFTSIYMHLDSYCVSAGTIVSAGQKIGKMGATGIATGDHLHFGISYNGVYVNPCNYVS